MVAYVAAEENEGVGVGSSADQAAEVADGVAGTVEEIEGAVGEVVKSWELPNCEAIWAAEVDFDEIPSSGLG